MIYWEILLGSEDVKGTLERLYEEFHSVGTLAAHLGISVVTLRKKLKSLNIPFHARGGSHKRFEMDLLPKGWWNMSTDQLMHLTGYSAQYIRKLRRAKLCQLAQSIKTQEQAQTSDTSAPSSSSEESDQE